MSQDQTPEQVPSAPNVGADQLPDAPEAPKIADVAEVATPASVVGGLRRTRRGLWIMVAVGVPLALLVVVFATRPSASTREVRSPLLGKPAPAAESATIDGQPIRLADLKGGGWW